MSYYNVLDQLGLQYRTDKASNGHNYLKFYDRFLDEFRKTAKTVMEIGIGEGGSIRMWLEYFNIAKIVGVDIDPTKADLFLHDRVDVAIADAGDEGHMRAIANKYGHFDFINDDGGHTEEQQLNALRVLWPRLNRPGVYILEDVNGTEGVMQPLLKLCRDMLSDHRPEGFLASAPEFIAMCPGAIILRK